MTMTKKITVWLPPLLKDLLETMTIDKQIMVAQMGMGFYKYKRPMRKRIGHICNNISSQVIIYQLVTL
jgi:hypothetical protein